MARSGKPVIEFTRFMEETLRDVSEVALEYHRSITSGDRSGPEIQIKDGDPNQVLTAADVAVGGEIQRRILAQFPGHALLDEEQGYRGPAGGGEPEYTWVVDPIDGTSNFAAGTPLFGIMVGLLRGTTPVAGGVALPALDEIYLAERGAGARCNGSSISVTDETDLLATLVAYGIDSHREAPDNTRDEMQLLGEIVLNVRNLRSANSAFDQMMVARGAYGACLNRSSRIWDNVAPAIIIQEAGGRYTDFFGQPMDFTISDDAINRTYTWCTANPTLHDSIQEIIHRR
ncbi:MAG: inositol monophosphatase family protein [Alkalispirochaeta sp.]